MPKRPIARFAVPIKMYTKLSAFFITLRMRINNTTGLIRIQAAHASTAKLKPAPSGPVERGLIHMQNSVQLATITRDQSRLTHFILEILRSIGNAFQGSPFGNKISHPVVLDILGQLIIAFFFFSIKESTILADFDFYQ